MSTRQGSFPCAHCGDLTLHLQEQPNHILHAIITIFSCGLWCIVWMIDSSRQRPWRCSRCGKAYEPPPPPQGNMDPAEAKAQERKNARVLAIALAGVFSLAGLLAIVLTLTSLHRKAESPTETPAALTLPRSPETIIACYGKPDTDSSTEHSRPRPFIVTRAFEYRAANVMLIFVPEHKGFPVRSWVLAKCGQVTATGEISSEEARKRLEVTLGKASR